MKSLGVSVALFVFATIVMVGAANAACPHEFGLKSLNGNKQTRIIFKNRARSEEESFKIYWLDYNGRRKLYKHLFKGETFTINTFLTHPWLVTAPVPGGGEDCIKIYMPDPGRRVVTLR